MRHITPFSAAEDVIVPRMILLENTKATNFAVNNTV
jgi:hypothetical protein